MNKDRTSAGKAIPTIGRAMNYLVSKSRLYWELVILITLVLVFFEWRSIHYQLWGGRSLSPVDIVFVLGLGLIFFHVKQRKKRGSIKQTFQAEIPIFLFSLPIVMMVLLYSNQSALINVTQSLPRFTLVGLAIYMVMTSLVIKRIPKIDLLRYLLGCELAVATLYLFVFIFTRLSWSTFIYGEGTPALNFPFGSPNQAALFLALNLILGIGTALTLRKYLLLYYLTPIMIVGVFQTGSRSVTALLILGLAGLQSCILLRGMLINRFPKREIAHLILSTVFAGVCLFGLLDAQGTRALSVFGYNPVEIASGKMDSYRSEAWNRAIETTSSYTDISGGIYCPSPCEAQGLHNAYLDLWLNWGVLSLASFLIFLLVMLYCSGTLAWRSRDEIDFPIHAGLLVGVVLVAAAIYGNPLLHLKFVWVFFGIIISFQFIGNMKRQDLVN